MVYVHSTGMCQSSTAGSVRLHASAAVDDTGAEMCEVNDVIRHSSTTLRQAEELGQRLRSRGWTCATAESCTGGGIALALTSIPGSSDYTLGGVIAYANDIKVAQLGVTRATLARVGAVSEACAREMARGVRERLGAAVGIASTGIAGPGGATARKPVGLVYIAVATPEGEAASELRLDGDRLAIMRDAAAAALDLALTQVGARSTTVDTDETD